MITLALDPSTKSTGQAIFNDKELTNYGCITAGSSNLYKRIDKMIEELDSIIKTYKVENVVLEDVIPDDVHRNNAIFKALMYLQGFIMHKLDEYKLSSTFFVSSEQRKKCGIKTGAGIHRESLKPKDIAFVKSQFGISTNDDVADAICIGFAATGGVIKESQTIVTDDGFEFG